MPQGYTRNTSKSHRDHGYTSEAEARDEGIARALGAQSKTWVSCAKLALKRVAIAKEFLTADDVWAEIEVLGGGAAGNNAAIAGVFKWGQGAGLVEATDRSRLSTRDGRHRSRIALWRSRVYRKPTPETEVWNKTFGLA